MATSKKLELKSKDYQELISLLELAGRKCEDLQLPMSFDAVDKYIKIFKKELKK
jgi:hypothetical protein